MRADNNTTLAELKVAIATFARERDWEQFHAPKNLSMAISAETAELMEHFLWASADESRSMCQNPGKQEKIAEELADVVILSLQFANMTGIDVAAAIEKKISQNAVKYPVSKSKGRSSKYTEL